MPDLFILSPDNPILISKGIKYKKIHFKGKEYDCYTFPKPEGFIIIKKLMDKIT